MMSAAFGLLFGLLLSSCDPNAKAVSGMKVEIDITPAIVSSGFIQMNFRTNQEAYYQVGIVPIKSAPDTSRMSNVRTFMTLELDKAYADYLYWRAALLEEGSPYVAEFATHSLQYGEVDYNFTLLQPDTEYMVYAFVVDAKSNKPDGRLFTYYVRTTKESLFENMQFEYLVRGYWDYYYPINGTTNEVYPYVPWTSALWDSLMLSTVDFANPAEAFLYQFQGDMTYQNKDDIHFGIYVRNSEGYYQDSFSPGHVYYVGMALMDGYLSRKSLVIYKFRWDGESTQLLFTDEDKLTTDW